MQDKPARRKLRSAKIFSVWLVLLALFTSVNTSFIYAAEPATSDRNTIISNDGNVINATVAATQAAGATTSTSFNGVTRSNMDSGIDDIANTARGADGNSVIGYDNRVRVNPTTGFPYRAIVHLTVRWSYGSGTCTGWMIGPRTVATAGHCVYNKSLGGWATSVVAAPGKNGSYNPYGTTTARRLFTVLGWTNYQDTNYDYAAIQLNSTIGNNVGWFGFRWTTASLQGTAVNISGYPGDKAYGTQWIHWGGVNNGTYKLTYTIDTYGGQSGAPVYQSSYPYCGVCSIAIHTNGGSSLNAGTRITQSVFNNLIYWRNYPY